MITKTFDEFVKEQVARADELKFAIEIEWPERLATWQRELNQLYSDMEKYLKKYIKAGDIKKERDNITITEPNVSSYEVEQLTFFIGTEKIVARPIGTQLIGTKGRVDLISRRGSIKILLLEKSSPVRKTSTSLSSHITCTYPRSLFHDNIVDEEGWYITSPPPRIIVTAFNKSTFKEAIMELADV